jgi:hypothetical protein
MMVVRDPDDNGEGVKKAADSISEFSPTALSLRSHRTLAEGGLRAPSEAAIYRTYNDVMNDKLREAECEDKDLHARRLKPGYG